MLPTLRRSLPTYRRGPPAGACAGLHRRWLSGLGHRLGGAPRGGGPVRLSIGAVATTRHGVATSRLLLAEANAGAETRAESSEVASLEGSGQAKPLSASDARASEPPLGQATKKLQGAPRVALGGVGAVLALGGIGGYAWLQWPLMSPSTACAITGMLGVALLSVAARGSMPQAERKRASLATPALELKLLNDRARLENELQALSKFAERRAWPQGAQAALVAADKAAEKAEQKTREERARQMLEEIRREIASGVTPREIRARLRPRLFVFDYKAFAPGAGVPPATRSKAQLEVLATTVSFIIASASKHDEVLVRLSSPGGGVTTYGLAAAQLQRLRDHGLRLTVCVDEVAASGGYMMACVANRIVAAPLAMVGSIGVLAGMPNFHRLLEHNNVEYRQVTAGKYKRTMNMLTANTDEGLAKFQEECNVIHEAFKEHVAHWRPGIDIESIATGEVWFGRAALERRLIDELGLSDSEIRAREAEGYDVIEVTPAKAKKQGLAKLLGGASLSADELCSRLASATTSMWRGMVEQQSAPPARLEAPHLRSLED